MNLSDNQILIRWPYSLSSLSSCRLLWSISPEVPASVCASFLRSGNVLGSNRLVADLASRLLGLRLFAHHSRHLWTPLGQSFFSNTRNCDARLTPVVRWEREKEIYSYLPAHSWAHHIGKARPRPLGREYTYLVELKGRLPNKKRTLPWQDLSKTQLGKLKPFRPILWALTSFFNRSIHLHLLSPHPALYLCISVSLYLCISVSLHLCISASLYLCISVSLCLCVSVSLYLCRPIPVSLYLFISLSLYLFISLSVSFSLSLYLCISVSLYQSLHLGASLFVLFQAIWALSMHLTVLHLSFISLCLCFIYFTSPVLSVSMISFH